MRPNANIIKTYWQAMELDGGVWVFSDEKPTKPNGHWGNNRGGCSNQITFPIPLKPLQIAEIKVNENGTWSYEIEREEGFYWAKKKGYDSRGIVHFKGGEQLDIDGRVLTVDLSDYTISSNRIPDECII